MIALEQICAELGVRPLINASATQTPLGGSAMRPEVAQAMECVSGHFFEIRKMHKAVGRRIAELTKNEDAMVSAGVASALYLLSMTLLKMENPAAFERIPEVFPQGKSVILYKSHRVEYGCSIQQAGVSLREIGESGVDSDPHAELLEREIQNERPLFFLYVMAGLWLPKGAPALEEAIRVCKRYDVPVIVDAAAQLPPKSNLWELTEKGADVVLFSGGKDLRGPSHAGLILGKKEIVSVCRELISPQEGVGRFFKVGKEELAGMYTAVQCYMEQDENARLAWCEKQVEKLVNGLSGIAGVWAERAFPNEAAQPIPRVRIWYDHTLFTLSSEELAKHFLQSDLPIAVLPALDTTFYCNPMTMQEGESELILRELRKFFMER